MKENPVKKELRASLLLLACVTPALPQSAMSISSSAVSSPPISSAKISSPNADDPSPTFNSAAAAAMVTQPKKPPKKPNLNRPFSTVGIGVKASVLGLGFEAGTPLTAHSNLRAGINVLDYSRNLTSNGFSYDAQLHLRSFETHYDWFPFGGSFHMSPGMLVNLGTDANANPSVPGGQSFGLNNATYFSDPSDPVRGTGSVAVNRFAPMFLVGWGNLVPRTKHFNVRVEFGVLYQGSPNVMFNLTGSACDSPGGDCAKVNSDASFQNELQAQQTKINKEAASYQVIPVVSIGCGYRF
jgi:hypothetical protein